MGHERKASVTQNLSGILSIFQGLLVIYSEEHSMNED